MTIAAPPIMGPYENPRFFLLYKPQRELSSSSTPCEENDQQQCGVVIGHCSDGEKERAVRGERLKLG